MDVKYANVKCMIVTCVYAFVRFFFDIVTRIGANHVSTSAIFFVSRRSLPRRFQSFGQDLFRMNRMMFVLGLDFGNVFGVVDCSHVMLAAD